MMPNLLNRRVRILVSDPGEFLLQHSSVVLGEILKITPFDSNRPTLTINLDQPLNAGHLDFTLIFARSRHEGSGVDELAAGQDVPFGFSANTVGSDLCAPEAGVLAFIGAMQIDAGIETARIQIAAAAEKMLNGTVSFIEGAREITALRWRAALDQFDPDILPFVGIDSETDILPLGEVTKLWAPDALAKLQPEIVSAQEWAGDFGERHCHSLIRRFGSKARYD